MSLLAAALISGGIKGAQAIFGAIQGGRANKQQKALWKDRPT